MIQRSRPTRRSAHPGRSRAALELGLTALAILGALIVLRFLFAAVGVSDRVLAGAVVYGASAPLVLPLRLIPGGAMPFVGEASLADLTAAVLVLAVPLFALGRHAADRAPNRSDSRID